MREYIAVFDIGTSSVKGVLVDRSAAVTGDCSVPVNTYYGDNKEVEQSPSEWWEAVKEITDYWWKNTAVNPSEVTAVTFSGQMEDVIPIADGKFDRAVLYSDTRAVEEADYINKVCPALASKSGNTVKSSTPLAKILWLKSHQQKIYHEAESFVFSSKDFIIYKMTGRKVTDPVTASTTGMMDLKSAKWIPDVLNLFNIKKTVLPEILKPEENAGFVTESASDETGFLTTTKVLAGSGDAAASTLGAGAVNKGDMYFYVGTTGWAAATDTTIRDTAESVFVLSHMKTGMYITIAPLLNAGNVHQWALDFLIESSDTDRYELFDSLVNESPPGSNNLLFLPYIHGERCPVHDDQAKGAFVGISPAVNKNDFARSVIEGICFSYKQMIEETLPLRSKKYINLIGGGAESTVWCQILSDITGEVIRVPAYSEYLTALGAASSAFIHNGWTEDYQSFSESICADESAIYYYPVEENSELYSEQYKYFLNMYPGVKNVFSI